MSHLLILVPFLSVIILNLPFKTLMKRLAFWFCLLLTLAQIFLVIFADKGFWLKNIGIIGTFFNFNLAVDNLTLLMLLCIGIVLFITLLVSRHLITDDESNFNFINLLLLAMSGMNGVVLVRDIFSLYVFIEITAVVSFIMIAFDKDELAFEGAFKYIIMSAVASTFLISSIALILLFSGSTDFSAINASITASLISPLIILAIAIFVCALFIKAGLMPFHGWLPDAYSSAPAPVSVLLAGVMTKVVGVYTLIRIVTSLFGFENTLKQILLAVGALSIILAALLALAQNDFKRMLAYSSISQIGYIILGLGCGTPLGIAGASFHLFNHSIFKSLLFVNSAALEKETGTRDMDKMSGLAKKMPVTGVTSILGSLSAAGIPPLAGFWSKLIIVVALWVSGKHIYAVIAVLASVLTLAYLLSMQRRVFFGLLGKDFENVKEASLGLTLPALILAAIAVGVGLFFPFLLNSFVLPLGKILGG